uniref:DM13 domain-containing protein n=1 Tax=Syphacia muris TaxID=451379 RepID=A0A0N5ARK9_9BILA
MLQELFIVLCTAILYASGNVDEQQPVVIRLQPQRHKPTFLKSLTPPRSVPSAFSSSNANAASGANNVQDSDKQFGLNPLLPPSAQQPVLSQLSYQLSLTLQFTPREITTIPPPPPVNIPPDVQNQLIKFFGLDSFGIPGLTGNHPEGFAGAIEVKHLTSTGNNTDDGILTRLAVYLASPTFGNQLNQLYNEAAGPTDYHAGLSNIPLPEATPGENGLIGLLSSSVRKLVHDSGIADAMQQGLPTVLGTNKSPEIAHSTDGENLEAEAAASDSGIRRQQTVAQRALSGIAAALGGTAGNGPAHAGLPRIPGIPLLPGGIPRNAQGQIDVVQLIGSITRRITNGTTVADIIPPEQLQTLADNVTDALLPPTPEDFDLQKFMGRWFEGINSPRATEQRCIVHHYGGLTKNDKTATFTALKIYREGSEFGPVRYSIGYAFRGGNKHAMLQLHSSESADAQPCTFLLFNFISLICNL